MGCRARCVRLLVLVVSEVQLVQLGFHVAIVQLDGGIERCVKLGVARPAELEDLRVAADRVRPRLPILA